MQTALSSANNIVEWDYFGHAGPGVLYLAGAMGKEYNISEHGGRVDLATDSTPVNKLPIPTFANSAQIYLDGCSTGKHMNSPQLGNWGTQNSIAQTFANYFKVKTRGTQAGIGFDQSGPYMRVGRSMAFGFGLDFEWYYPR